MQVLPHSTSIQLAGVAICKRLEPEILAQEGWLDCASKGHDCPLCLSALGDTLALVAQSNAKALDAQAEQGVFFALLQSPAAGVHTTKWSPRR